MLAQSLKQKTTPCRWVYVHTHVGHPAALCAALSIQKVSSNHIKLHQLLKSVTCTHKEPWPRRTGVCRTEPGWWESEQKTSAARARESSKTLLIILSYIALEGNTRRVRQHLKTTVFKSQAVTSIAFSYHRICLFETWPSTPLGQTFPYSYLCTEEQEAFLLMSSSTAKSSSASCQHALYLPNQVIKWYFPEATKGDIYQGKDYRTA